MTTTDQSQTPRPGWRASWTTEWCEGVDETEVNPVIRSLWNDVKTRCERGLKAGPACEWVNERPVLYRMLTCMGSCSPQFWYRSSLLPALFQCFRSNARHLEIAWFFFFLSKLNPRPSNVVRGRSHERTRCSRCSWCERRENPGVTQWWLIVWCDRFSVWLL